MNCWHFNLGIFKRYYTIVSPEGGAWDLPSDGEVGSFLTLDSLFINKTY